MWLLLLLLVFVSSVQATYDPLSVPNNKIGVHIFAPDEIEQAAKLVNSQNGEWGYVTVPIRSNDRDKEKWQVFFEKTKKLRVIPVLRLSTYPIGEVWAKPELADLVDFANFLNDLPWPTKNRYVILFNEPNHAYEWGGQVDVKAYTDILLAAKDIFKSRSGEFYLLSAGLDMAVPNSGTSLDALEFYRQMTLYKTNWLEAVDGLSVHAYPNPGFMSSPLSTHRRSIVSYKYELAYLKTSKPIFITETGTARSDDFYTPAFTQVWTDPQIVAVTPFVLYAGTGPFAKFSLLDAALQPNHHYFAIANIPKLAGSPLLADITISSPREISLSTPAQPSSPLWRLWGRVHDLFYPPPKVTQVTINQTKLQVEIADTDQKRQRGLSGRTNLPENSGMLFVFPKADKHAFWMKDMHFALDFVWIRANKVVQIHSQVLPPAQTNNQPQILTPDQPVDQVLEVNAGFTKTHDLKVGDDILCNCN